MADISWTEYVDKYGDLKEAWHGKTGGDPGIESGGGTQFDYWNPLFEKASSKEEFGRMHWKLEGSKNAKRDLTPLSTSTDVSTATQPTITLPDYEKPDKPVTPGAEERPDYEGPEYVDWRDEDPTPVGITLAEVQDDELVENRLTNLLDKNSPLFREAAEMIMRRNAGRGLGRNVSMAQEEVMSAIFKVAQPIVMADALMLERHRTLRNTSYYQQMNTRLTGAIQEALAHVAGGYQIQATMINDITNRWKSQLAADIQAYGVDVGAAAKIYGTDVAAATTIYDTDVKKWLGMEGLKVKFAEIYSNIEDNAEAAAFLWDMVFGDNDLNPSEWVTKWGDKFGVAAGQGDTTSTDNDTQSIWKSHITGQLTGEFKEADWKHAYELAKTHNIQDWFTKNYGTKYGG